MNMETEVRPADKADAAATASAGGDAAPPARPQSIVVAAPPPKRPGKRVAAREPERPHRVEVHLSSLYWDIYVPTSKKKTEITMFHGEKNYWIAEVIKKNNFELKAKFFIIFDFKIDK